MSRVEQPIPCTGCWSRCTASSTPRWYFTRSSPTAGSIGAQGRALGVAHHPAPDAGAAQLAGNRPGVVQQPAGAIRQGAQGILLQKAISSEFRHGLNLKAGKLNAAKREYVFQAKIYNIEK